MTNIEKTQFFAQHFGQKVLHIRNSPIPFYMGSIKVEDVSDTDYLSLTRLEDITDEDKREAIKIGCFEDVLSVDIHENEDGLHWTIFFARPKFGKNSTVEPVPSFVIDYLRSKSYLLPWRNYTVEQLIEEGVVKTTAR